MESISVNEKIRSKWKISNFTWGGQSNWENDAKGRKFQGGTELSAHMGEACLTPARTLSRSMLPVSRTSPFTEVS